MVVMTESGTFGVLDISFYITSKQFPNPYMILFKMRILDWQNSSLEYWVALSCAHQDSSLASSTPHTEWSFDVMMCICLSLPFPSVYFPTKKKGGGKVVYYILVKMKSKMRTWFMKIRDVTYPRKTGKKPGDDTVVEHIGYHTQRYNFNPPTPTCKRGSFMSGGALL